MLPGRHRALDALRRVLAGVGDALDDVVFARVYLTRFERDYVATNAVYQSYFVPGKLPARTCIGVTALAGPLSRSIYWRARRLGETYAPRKGNAADQRFPIILQFKGE